MCVFASPIHTNPSMRCLTRVIQHAAFQQKERNQSTRGFERKAEELLTQYFSDAHIRTIGSCTTSHHVPILIHCRHTTFSYVTAGCTVCVFLATDISTTPHRQPIRDSDIFFLDGDLASRLLTQGKPRSPSAPASCAYRDGKGAAVMTSGQCFTFGCSVSLHALTQASHTIRSNTQCNQIAAFWHL